MTDNSATANLPATTKSETPSLPSLLSDRQQALLLSGESPVVGPKTAAALREFAAAQPALPLPERDQIDAMIARLSVATAKKATSKDEARELVDLYWRALRDLPLTDLHWAFDELLRTATFLPKPAEVRAMALRPAARRNYLRSRARHLAWKHDVEWRPPVELATPEDVQAVLAGLRVGPADGAIDG